MATKFDLTNLNPGTWFTFGDPKDEAKVKIKVCSGNDFKVIQKATTTEKFETRRIDGRMERVSIKKVDDDAQNDMIWDFCIADWEGFIDQTGKPILCTKENKLLLMGKSVKFSAFIADKISELREIEMNMERESEKN